MASAQTMTWDAEADRKLLLGIIQSSEVSIDYNRMATHMGCTVGAVKNRVKKLRALAREAHGDASAPGTPVTPKSTGKRKKKTTNGDHADEDDEVDPTPTKKAKGRAKKEVEVDNDEDVVKDEPKEENDEE